MFGSLFDEEGDSPFATSIHGPSLPPKPRLQCGLGGIDNLGATCYLNSLLQTLLFTPEFRESLFGLTETDLGRLEDKEKHDAKVRIIPLQLQRLFVRLLLSNRQSVSTTELLESFGWTNREEFQQQDVQELNRILFSAIEDSLVGTPGQDLIRQLYHGLIVNKIKCLKCGKVSEREEDFLDLTVTISGNAGLEQALQNYYCDEEMMDGRNQYRCDSCAQLVNAVKGAKLRSLPSVLTVSLLRFNFDFVKMTRYKETGKFTFPVHLNMSPYTEKSESAEENLYELFSVVIHRGSAYGGHYHAYIRDVDDLGTWTNPETAGVQVPADPTTGKSDFIDCSSPVDLIQVILTKNPDKAMSVDQLCADMLKQTGVSWNKRFKKTYGPITKFLKKYNDKFFYNPDVNWVSLQPEKKTSTTPTSASSNNARDPQPAIDPLDQSSSNNDPQPAIDPLDQSSSNNDPQPAIDPLDQSSSNNDPQPAIDPLEQSNSTSDPQPAIEPLDQSNNTVLEDTNDNCHQELSLQSSKAQVVTRQWEPHKSNCEPPGKGQQWFHFDDSRVTAIDAKEIEKQYAGKESAYMLFYRRKSMLRTPAACRNRMYGIPENLIMEVVAENALLDQQRSIYEQEVNEIKIQLHFHWTYHFVKGALNSIDEPLYPLELLIDRRKTLQDLFISISELVGELTGVQFRLHQMRAVPAGFHLYDELTDRDELLMNLSVDNDTMLFVWDGETVQGKVVKTGVEFEPVYLNIIYGNPSHCSEGFPKNMTLFEFRKRISEITGIRENQLVLKRFVGEGPTAQMINLEPRDFAENGRGLHDVTLRELQLKDTEQIFVEDDTESVIKVERFAAADKACFFVRVENRCTKEGKTWCTLEMEVEKNMTVSELKQKIIIKFGLDQVDAHFDLRLREDNPSQGLKPPYHEELSLDDAGITRHSLLILENGRPPRTNEITLKFTLGKAGSALPDQEITVDRGLSVNASMQCMIQQAGLSGNDWHLRRTNWIGEAGEVLDDGEISLQNCLINDGDLLLLEPGRLPPKGFLRLMVWLYPPSAPPESSSSGSTLNWITNKLAAMFSGNSDSSNSGETALFLGDIDISKDATLEDLRLQIMTLPGAADLPILMPDFMRVRLLEGKDMRTVLRGKQNTLRRLKVNSHSHLAVQILLHEDRISANHVVLNVQLRDSATRRYGPVHELIWDTGSGSSTHSLQQAVADLLALPVEGICIAKHFPQNFEWMILQDIIQKTSPGSKKGKKKKKKSAKSNIRLAPYHIQDGDLIGVKILAQDPTNQDDFTTEEDTLGKEKKMREIEEKKKMLVLDNGRSSPGREERKKSVDSPVVRRPEVPLHIRVDKFT